jgi:hypothetical protein
MDAENVATESTGHTHMEVKEDLTKTISFKTAASPSHDA